MADVKSALEILLPRSLRTGFRRWTLRLHKPAVAFGYLDLAHFVPAVVLETVS